MWASHLPIRYTAMSGSNLFVSTKKFAPIRLALALATRESLTGEPSLVIEPDFEKSAEDTPMVIESRMLSVFIMRFVCFCRDGRK